MNTAPKAINYYDVTKVVKLLRDDHKEFMVGTFTRVSDSILYDKSILEQKIVSHFGEKL